MPRTRSLLLAVLALALGATAASQAGWTHFTNTVRTPDGTLRHASELVHTVILGTATENTKACVGYSRESNQRGKGKVVAKVSFALPDGETAALNFAPSVKDNSAFVCKDGPDAPVGTVVQFAYEFRGMPRLAGRKGQYSDTRSIVSAGDVEVAPLGLTPGGEDLGRIVSAVSIFAADKTRQQHPEALAQTLVTNRLLLEPMACVSYQRMAQKPNQGRVISKWLVSYPDGESETLSFSGGVSRGEFIRCKELSRDAPAGTMVESDIEYRKMPRLRDLKNEPEYSLTTTSLSTAGEVAFRQPPVADNPPADDDDGGGGGTPPPPPPGGGSGALSAADRDCISRLLYAPGPGSRQIVRPRGNKGGKFEVFGPNSIFSGGVVNVGTLGFGPTYAAACADYVRKRGPIGPAGPALSSRDVNNWIWYGNMSSSAGPTAVRRDPRGGYHVDYWRPWSGAVILNVGSPNQGIELLRSRGL